jgi:hypothetical protein
MNNLIGKKFGNLKVLEIITMNKYSKSVLFLKCLCDCGNIKLSIKHHVLNGHIKSCGCLRSTESSNRMKLRNPMWMKGIKEKAMATNKRLGTRPLIRGGNGKEMPVAQRILLTALGKGWYGEHTVPTKVKKSLKIYPTCYKIDIANPEKMIGIEVDGNSHQLLSRKIQDKKKTLFLEKLGWKILRFKNKEVMTNLQKVLNAI